MTHEEYKQLLHEWNTCDSMSRKRDIKNTILEAAKQLLQKLNSLYRKYDPRFVYEDYSETRGITEVKCSISDENECCLNYWDRLEKGGYCDTYMYIPMKMLDKCNMVKFENELRVKRLEELKDIIKNLKSQLVDNSELLKKSENEPKTLKENTEKEDNE